jgi:hypothetical protein
MIILLLNQFTVMDKQVIDKVMDKIIDKVMDGFFEMAEKPYVARVLRKWPVTLRTTRRDTQDDKA